MTKLSHVGSAWVLQESISREVAAYSEQVAKMAETKGTVRLLCELCPCRRFTRASDLQKHVERSHQAGKTHPVRGFDTVVKAVHNSNTCPPWEWLVPREAGAPLGHPLLDTPVRRAVALTRRWNDKVWMPYFENKKRNFYVILYTEHGGKFLARSHPEVLLSVKISQRARFSPSLVREIAAKSLMLGGKATAIRQHLFHAASRSPHSQGLASLMPEEKPLRDLLEAVFCGPTIEGLIDDCRQGLSLLTDELSDVSIDGTVKVTQATAGQRPVGSQGPVADLQENTCITIRGRTGALLGLKTVRGESFDDVLLSLRTAVPQHLRQKVVHLCTDSPAVLWSKVDVLRAEFPGLRVISEDPTHGKFRVERNGKKSVCGSLMLRLNCIFFGEANLGGAYCDPGFGAKEAQAAFDAARKDMTLDEATSFFLEPPRVSPQAYGRGLAAVCAIGHSELDKKAAKGASERTVGEVIACQANHYGALQNYSCRLAEMTEAQREDKAMGTSGNEALHNELRRLTDTVHRQRRFLLRYKLQGFLLAKIAAHMLRKTTTSGNPQGVAIAEVAAQIIASTRPLVLLHRTPEEHLKEQAQRAADTAFEVDYQKRVRERKILANISKGIPPSVLHSREAGRNNRAKRSFALRAENPRAAPSMSRAAEKQKTFRKLLKKSEAEAGCKATQRLGPIRQAPLVVPPLLSSQIADVATSSAQTEDSCWRCRWRDEEAAREQATKASGKLSAHERKARWRAKQKASKVAKKPSPKTAQERKQAFLAKHGATEGEPKKAPMTAVERKQRFLAKQGASEVAPKKSPMTAAERKQRWLAKKREQKAADQ